MKERSVLVILVGNRKDSAVNVQKVLTAWGCMIKTRLGLHEGIMESCSERGLIIIELVGEKGKKEELVRKLALIKGVKSELVSLSLDEEKKAVKAPVKKAPAKKASVKKTPAKKK